jgi:hypothetical protein
MMPSTPQKRSSPGPDATEPDEPQTPFGQPPTKKIKITQRQKQALMDNLQLESTFLDVIEAGGPASAEADSLQ